jgi:glycine cleavage system H lipoate-binding protein
MTVILVLATFAVFVVIDYILSRKEATSSLVVPVRTEAAVEPDPDWVEGFQVPAKLEYHPGHSWLLRERRNVERVGIDQFAGSLLGKIDTVQLPKPGHWIRQGQAAFSFFRNGEKTEVVSPAEGEVVEINEEVLKNPALLREDPYGKGWLVMVHAPDEESTRRNLLPTPLVRSWMRDAVRRLYALQPQLAGASAADGGVPVTDPLGNLRGVSWERTTREFFLS